MGSQQKRFEGGVGPGPVIDKAIRVDFCEVNRRVAASNYGVSIAMGTEEANTHTLG